MSYETNPILNRLKVVKGWKTSSFPTKTLNYSRDLRVWFKLYLFLKVYLWLHGLSLLSYEVRVTENLMKCIYLMITKLPKKKKKESSKWKDKSFLKGLNSPLSAFDTKKGRFLLYLDIDTLKKKVLRMLQHSNSKLLSQEWNAKPQKRSWINTSFWIWQQRQRAKKYSQRTWKKKVFLLSHMERASKKFKFQQKQKSSFFWEKKKRLVFSLLTKIQKDIAFSEKAFYFIWQQALMTQSLTLLDVMTHVEKNLKKKKIFLRQLTQFHQFFQHQSLNVNHRIVQIQGFAGNFKKKKFHGQQANSRLQASIFSAKSFFFLSSTKRKLACAHQKGLGIVLRNFAFDTKGKAFVKNFSPRCRYRRNLFFVSSFKKIKSLSKNPTRFDTCVHGINKKNQQQNLLLLRELPKTKLLRRPHLISFQDNLLWIRLAKKKRKIKPVFQKNKSVTNQEPLFYQLSLQKNSRKLLTVTTHVKLKYLLQDLIQKYFAVKVLVKVSWPLLQFKNLKFYRLIFREKYRPTYKQTAKEIQHRTEPDYTTVKYLYVGQTTPHLRFRPLTQTKNLVNKGWVSAKLLGFLHSEKKRLQQRNSYLAEKAHQLKMQGQQRLGFASKMWFIPGLVTTLTLFGKYLDPQPLADHLVKLISKTKKHVKLLYSVETILKTFPLKRGLGYRIALTGRLNGADKSRTLYLRKLKKNRARQTLAKQVNYAVAYAPASIGAFSVKIWVYV